MFDKVLKKEMLKLKKKQKSRLSLPVMIFFYLLALLLLLATFLKLRHVIISHWDKNKGKQVVMAPHFTDL